MSWLAEAGHAEDNTKNARAETSAATANQSRESLAV